MEQCECRTRYSTFVHESWLKIFPFKGLKSATIAFQSLFKGASYFGRSHETNETFACIPHCRDLPIPWNTRICLSTVVSSYSKPDVWTKCCKLVSLLLVSWRPPAVLWLLFIFLTLAPWLLVAHSHAKPLLSFHSIFSRSCTVARPQSASPQPRTSPPPSVPSATYSLFLPAFLFPLISSFLSGSPYSHYVLPFYASLHLHSPVLELEIFFSPLHIRGCATSRVIQ